MHLLTCDGTGMYSVVDIHSDANQSGYHGMQQPRFWLCWCEPKQDYSIPAEVRAKMRWRCDGDDGGPGYEIVGFAAMAKAMAFSKVLLPLCMLLAAPAVSAPHSQMESTIGSVSGAFRFLDSFPSPPC